MRSSAKKTIQITRPQELTRLRRLALAAQGLLQIQPFGRGLAGARAAIQHLGYVQIDTISVVERAHHHVLRTRVPQFTPDMTNQMLRAGDIFEYWTHAAAFLPMADFRYSLPYKHAIKSGQTHWYKNPDQKLMAELLARVHADGALRSRDVETNTSKRGAWWDWKPAKKALEQLYMQGDLMVSDREGFQKAYDLTERVLPSLVDAQMPSMDEFANHLVNQQLRCHGLVSVKGLTYQRRNLELRQAVKALIDERLAQGALEQVQVDTGELFVLEAGALDRRLPRRSRRMMILSPFDNSVIQRDRLKVLFQYDYQLECYVPASKRQYGYFSLPLLFGDEFIGRMDCKVHRKTSHLEIRSLHFEQHNFEQDSVNAALLDAIIQFCQFQRCDLVTVKTVYPEHLSQSLHSALKRLA